MLTVKELDSATLQRMYVDENLTIKDISRLLGAGNRRVSRELKRHGIAKPYHAIKHGMCETRQYRIWRGMKNRCDNPQNSRYKYYGAKGIGYCEKWKTFDGFWDDMANGYSDNLTLDRIDNASGYSKDNCAWRNYSQQNANRSGCFEWEKSSLHVRRNAKVSQSTVYRRKRKGWDDDKIINTP